MDDRNISLTHDGIQVAVDVMITSVCRGRLIALLGRRPAAPYAQRWALPGCLMTETESADAAVERLMGEMLPGEIQPAGDMPPGASAWIEQLYTFTGINRDPRKRVISIAYLVMIPWGRLIPRLSGSPLKPFVLTLSGETLTAQGEDGGTLTGGDLAFDHGRIVRMGVQRLRGKVDYTDIAFHYLGDDQAFPLGELQEIYEAILGRRLDSGNFRRSILSRYEERGWIRQTARSSQGGRGRPSVLYQRLRVPSESSLS